MTNEEPGPEPKAQERDGFSSLLSQIRIFLYHRLNIREGTDIQGTIEGIKKDIIFKGPNIWILICSIFIACIGLNVNSTPVIIGAMLISPLMGPILGIGLSIGINDFETLVRSIKNFAIAVVVSVITSTVYFMVTPISEFQPELVSRTTPTFLDALIAIFGGMAGIIAGSRKEKSNVIPGVAIATALMPPLCTAGFGIANGDPHFFFGAFYLFFLNTIFISISTLVVVRILKFPRVKWVDPKKEKRFHRYLIIFVVASLIPSGVIFYDVILDSWFRTKAEKFVSEQVNYAGADILNKKMTFNDTLSTIDLYFIGEIVPNSEIVEWKSAMKNYDLKNTELRIHQAKDASDELAGKLSDRIKMGIIENIYEKNEALLKDREKRIAFLEKKLLQQQKDSIPYIMLQREIKVQYPMVERFSYAKMVESDFAKAPDTVPTFLIKWDKKVSRTEKRTQGERLRDWLTVRLMADTLRVIEY